MNDLPDIDRLLYRYPLQEALVIEAMVTTYRAGLYRLALSMLRDADEADDAIQHTFLAAILNLARYRPGSNFKAWLYTIAVNTCRGMLRKRKTRQTITNLLGFSQPQTEHSPNPEEIVLQDEAARLLWSAVERLGEKHRLVVLLRFQQGMSINEIAQVLSMREKTVYTRLFEAFKRLRSQITADAEPVWRETFYQEEVTP